MLREPRDPVQICLARSNQVHEQARCVPWLRGELRNTLHRELVVEVGEVQVVTVERRARQPSMMKSRSRGSPTSACMAGDCSQIPSIFQVSRIS